MKKGVVLEVNGDIVTLLTPEGEFIQVLKERPYQIGEEIENIPIQQQKIKKSFFRRSPLMMVAASIAAVSFLIFTYIANFASNEVYAYLSIDINPSIELSVNEDLEVIKIKGYNNDGKKIVNLLVDWKEKELTEVAERIIQLSMEKNYLRQGEEVLITTVEKKRVPRLSKQIQEQINKVEKTYKSREIIVTKEKSTIEVRNEAAQKGFTTGKYMKLTKQNKEKENEHKDTPSSAEQGKNENLNKSVIPKSQNDQQKQSSEQGQSNNKEEWQRKQERRAEWKEQREGKPIERWEGKQKEQWKRKQKERNDKKNDPFRDNKSSEREFYNNKDREQKRWEKEKKKELKHSEREEKRKHRNDGERSARWEDEKD